MQDTHMHDTGIHDSGPLSVFNASEMRIPSASVAVLGLWLIISPFVLGYTNIAAGMWNSIIVGVVMFIVAVIRELRPRDTGWLSWINVILAVWLWVSLNVLGFQHLTNAMVWNFALVGIFALLGAAFSGGFSLVEKHFS